MYVMTQAPEKGKTLFGLSVVNTLHQMTTGSK